MNTKSRAVGLMGDCAPAESRSATRKKEYDNTLARHEALPTLRIDRKHIHMPLVLVSMARISSVHSQHQQHIEPYTCYTEDSPLSSDWAGLLPTAFIESAHRSQYSREATEASRLLSRRTLVGSGACLLRSRMGFCIPSNL